MSRKKLTSATLLVALLLALSSALSPVVHVKAYIVLSAAVDQAVVQEGDLLTVTINIKCLEERAEFSFIECKLPIGFQFLSLESSRIYRSSSGTWADQDVDWYDPLMSQRVDSPMIIIYTGFGFESWVFMDIGDEYEVKFKLRANIPGTYQLSPNIIGFEGTSEAGPIITIQPLSLPLEGESTDPLLPAIVAAIVAAFVASAVSLAGIFWFRRDVSRRPVAKEIGSKKKSTVK